MRKMRLLAMAMAGVMVLSTTGCSEVGTIAQAVSALSSGSGAVELSKKGADSIAESGAEANEDAETDADAKTDAEARKDEEAAAVDESKSSAKNSDNKTSKDNEVSAASDDNSSSGKISRSKKDNAKETTKESESSDSKDSKSSVSEDSSKDNKSSDTKESASKSEDDDSSTVKNNDKNSNKNSDKNTDDSKEDTASDKDSKNSANDTDKNSDSDSEESTDSSSAAVSDESDSAASEQEQEQQEPKKSVLDSLPKTGDEIHGFKVTDITDYEPKSAKIVSMTHEQTGAEVLYIACDDTDKAVGIYFRTTADNDKGIPHIFEHATISGSGKYPNANIFMDLSEKCYKTYMNATTFQEATGYIMSSLSDVQLQKIADMYMAGLTDPLALKDDNVLGREAYRFSLEGLDDDISVTGAVFNEMEAANANLESFAYQEALKVLYPSSRMSYNAGGVREDIITVTQDELKAYHDKYYHPSNMLIVLYGDLDYEQYLESFDKDYLSDYSKANVTVSDSKYIPWTGVKYASIDYPVSEDSSDEDGSIIYYDVSLGNMSARDTRLMSIIASLLSVDSSVLNRKAAEEFPGASFNVYVSEDLDQPVFMFVLSGCNKGDSEAFKAMVDAGIEETVKEGLSKDYIEAVVQDNLIDNALSQEASGGIGTMQSFANSWAVYGDKLAYVDKVEAVEELEGTGKGSILDDMIEEYLYEPVQAAITEVNPKPGLLEANDEAWANQLKEKKALMSKSDQAKLIGETAEYDAWSESQSDTSEYLDKLIVVGRDELEEEVQEDAVIEDETQDNGIRTLTSVLDDVIYLDSTFYLKADTLDYDEIHDMVFLNELLGRLGTEQYSADELFTKLCTNVYQFNTKLSVIYDAETGKPQPYFAVNFTNMADKTKDAYAFVQEILGSTSFEDINSIRSYAAEAAVAFKSQNSGNQLALNVAKAAADDDMRYEYHALSTDYYNYLVKVSKMSDKQLTALSKELESVLKKLLNVNGAVLAVVGDKDAVETGKESFENLSKDFTTEELPAVDYSKELAELKLPKSIAVAVNDTVNYNGFVADNEITGLENNGKNAVCMSVLYSQLMFPTFRYDIGAYAFLNQVGDRASYMMSYRDPSVAESFAAMEEAPDKLKDLELSDDDIEQAILDVYSGYAKPKSKLNLAATEIDYILQNKSETYTEETLANMKSAKSTTAKDISAFADELQSLIDDGVRFTAGSSSSIKANKELYELVISDMVK